MKRTTIMVACVVLGGLGGPAVAREDAPIRKEPAAASPAVLLEKGIYTEETVGDLDKAIAIYRRIAKEAKAARKYAARALYRLATCYLKKGDEDKAEEALRELLASYPEQESVAAKARRELAKLSPVGRRPARLPADVMGHIIRWHYGALAVAKRKGIHANSHIYGVDDRFNLYFGGLLFYVNDTGKPQAGPIHLGNFGPKKKDYLLTDERGRAQAYEFRKRPDTTRGKWALWWKPDRPVEPNAVRLLGYLDKQVRPLPQAEGVATLTMSNVFGAPVLESFFLVVPPNVSPAEGTPEPTAKATIGGFVIYLWQDEVPASTNHEVTVAMTQRDPDERAGPPAAADKKTAEDLAADGWRLWKTRKLAEAETKFQAAAAKDPTNANAWNGLGWARFNQRKTTQAKEAFAKAVALDPNSAGALNGLGWIAKGQGRIDDAIARWKQALAAEPGATAARNGLAATYAERGEYDKAVAQYRAWLKLEPDSPEARTALARAEEAAEAVKAAIPAAEAWLKLVDKRRYGDSWEAAAALLQKATTKNASLKSLQAARAPLGKVKSREVISAVYRTALPGAPDGQYVVIQFEAAFANKRRAVETVTPMLAEDGKWRVSGYYVK
jgi:tetratricopeptide (TPR) repeat protein